MGGIVEAIIAVLAVLGAGGFAWVGKLKHDKAKDETRRAKAEIRRLQEREEKKKHDTRERKAEEAKQREKGDAVGRLRDSRWMRDD